MKIAIVRNLFSWYTILKDIVFYGQPSKTLCPAASVHAA